ncbi:unnamed protein product [Acanthoscelides obtectus]|uniref:Chitin-binding type-2 domain-containing protein n=1 Tax=Acanthoscelides obtectus TaxID=200917 RepID=A0A9P0JRQ3_ACAOB|nr:unnamed protein product [Acanthoscelides obtectus]CAK1679311.1 hypothetical protein AOBTE_LOCUS32207 [Acanthoscelides obtectus]
MKVMCLVASLLAITLSVEAVPSCPEKDAATPVYYPHEIYCYKFYECSNGIAYELECAPPLNWNQAHRICEVNVDCESLKPRS